MPHIDLSGKCESKCSTKCARPEGSRTVSCMHDWHVQSLSLFNGYPNRRRPDLRWNYIEGVLIRLVTKRKSHTFRIQNMNFNNAVFDPRWTFLARCLLPFNRGSHCCTCVIARRLDESEYNRHLVTAAHFMHLSLYGQEVQVSWSPLRWHKRHGSALPEHFFYFMLWCR